MTPTSIEGVSSVRQKPHRIGLSLIILALVGVGVVSPYAILSVLFDGIGALLVVLPAVVGGLCLVPLFRLGALPLRWHLMLGAALGLGSLSTLILLGGLAGVMQRPVWIIVTLAAVAGGLLRLRQLARSDIKRDEAEVPDATGNGATMRYLWLLAAPFLAIALIAASNAPGLIWQEEGFGYDVLEYHLQLPKEHLQAGHIAYLPHNVYSAFPANVEMLYLLDMILQDNDLDTGVSANLIHLLLAILTVGAAWTAAREWLPQAGVIAGVTAASVGWLTYLSGLAYVENGMLFFGMAAAAVVLRVAQSDIRAAGFSQRGAAETITTAPERYETPRKLKHAAHFSPHGVEQPLRWIVLGGVLAGFACGCKYTALPLIALPLGIAVLLLPGRTVRKRFTEGAVFGLATIAAFSPWLIKNVAATGNPVFPLMNNVFEASPEGWGPEQTAQWDRGHRVLPHQRTIGARLSALWQHVPGDRLQRFGPLILLLGTVGLLGRRRDRVDLILATVLIIQLGVWLFATHLFARFTVVMLIPLVLLAGRVLIGSTCKYRTGAVYLLIAIGAGWNLMFAAKLIADEKATGAPASLIYDGELPGYEYFKTINHELPADARLLLIGDAKAFYFQRDVDYCVVFNRSSFAEAVRLAEDKQEITTWLQGRGYTHVLVNWSEIRRLRSTYGFALEVNEALFNRLASVGLSIVEEFTHPQTPARYITLYKVPN